MKLSHKPVRKCHGCGLNLRDHCGVFSYPREMWKRHKCTGYMNEELLQKYLADQQRKHVKVAKEERRAKMRLRQTEPHWQGVRGAVSAH